MNDELGNREYGDMIRKIAVIPVILPGNWLADVKERHLFRRKTREADYRLFIDYEKFKTGNRKTRELLLLKNIIDAVLDLKRKAKKGFDGERLINDIAKIFNLDPEELKNR